MGGPWDAALARSEAAAKREGLAGLGRRLADEGLGLPQRYRALYGLRNHPDDPAAVAGMLGALGTESKLLKHELAFALGQMRARAAIPTLLRLLKDEAENSMVRHEAAEALGAIASPECVALLKAHQADASRPVAESCDIALDILESEAQGEFEYAATLEDGAAAVVEIAT